MASQGELVEIQSVFTRKRLDAFAAIALEIIFRRTLRAKILEVFLSQGKLEERGILSKS